MRTKTNSSYAWFLSLAACAILSVISAAPASAQRQKLHTKISAGASAHRVGHPPSSQVMKLALTLSLRNPDQLQNLLQGLYNPKSPTYRQFLTVEQFTDQFGPTTDDYAKAVAFVAKYGLTVTNTSPNRLVLDVSGTVGQIEQAFQITMQLYQHPTENRTYHAPNVEPSVDAGVPVQGISGLNDFMPPRPIGLKQVPADQVVRTNQTGSGPDGFFLGSDMRAAYAPGTTLTGAGQSIGLFEFGPYNLSDVQAYFDFVGQPLDVPIVNVLIDGQNPTCGAGCDDGEEVIDIQQAISMAPGLSAVIVYEGGNDTDMFNQMATDNIAKSLSCSFGFLPADPLSDEPIFQEFAAQGQNLFVASGDGGAYFGNPADCANFSNLDGCIFYPTDDPLITAVGGTDITTNGPGGTWQSETGWIGSGGGFSTNGFAIPSYQSPVITTANQGSTTLRNIPDVAAEANTDNFFCANGGCFIGVGGTSLAAPRWAGFLALANQQANGMPVGFVNPTIYALGQGSDFTNDLHDILTGNNFNSGSPSLFSDVVGFDLVTGWGSPNGQGLLNALGPTPTGPNFTLSSSPTTLDVTQGTTGNATITLTPVNGFTGTVNLSVKVLGGPAGVTLSLNTGAITTSGSATLTVSTTSATPGGNFPIVVTGVGAGLTQTAYITLALPGFSIVTPGSVSVNQGSSASGTITISPVNGFTGSVSLSAAGLPNGVTAVFAPPSTASASQLTFTAAATAATGTASITVTGTSGNIVQTATLNLLVDAATGTGGSGEPVSLAASYNLTGIYKDRTMFSSSGGLDGGGAAYSANLLTSSRILSGVQFKFGPADLPDGVSATGLPVALPAGHFALMEMLATGVQGNQTGQILTVNYTDGTSSQFTQSFSDWFSPSGFKHESIAVAMPYRDIFDGTQDNRTFNLYAYSFALNSAKTVKSFSMTNNRDVIVLAITLRRK